MKQKRDWPEWFSHLSLPEEEFRPQAKPSEDAGVVPEIAQDQQPAAHPSDGDPTPDDSVSRK